MSRLTSPPCPRPPEAGVTAQDVAPRLLDQHPVDGQHVKSNLNQDVLEVETR